MQSEDITAAAIVSLLPSSQTRRRSTISAAQTHPQIRTRASNSQCTHMTVTRLYTREFRCSICLRVAPLGWLYRCTQDRELLLYDDMERGIQDKFDKLCDLFELPSPPPKRHPVARLNRLSFLDEINDDQLKTYSKEQLNLILNQRAQVLETASELDPESDISFFSSKSCYEVHLKSSSASLESLSTPAKLPERPFLPLRGGECQYKCCQFCRQNMNERSYLSLNGIADGDIPTTAILGFGFHLSKKRPVALVKHVKNLGLRPSPSPWKKTEETVTADIAYKKILPTPSKLSKFVNRRNTNQSLGIFTTNMTSLSVINDKKDSLTSSKIHSHMDSVEQGFIALPTSASLSPDSTFSKQSRISMPLDVRDLQSLLQHQNTVGELMPPKLDAAQGTAGDTVLPKFGGMDEKVLIKLEPVVSTGENEKEALLELDINEIVELAAVVHVQAVQSDKDVTDVISQF